MASFQELMDAAVNADKAGDAEAARQLVQMAESMMGAGQPTQAERYRTEIPIAPTIDGTTRKRTGPQVDSFGPTIEAATRAPRQATAAYAAGITDPDRSITAQNLPDWVPDRLRRPAAIVGDAAMTGLMGAGTVYAFGAGLAGEMLGGSPTNERRLARDLMMAGEVAAPELAGISSTTRAVSRGAQAAERLDRAPTPRQQEARAASDLGVTPSLGAGGKVRAMTAAGLEKTPVAAEFIARDAERYVGEVERAFNAVTAQIGTPVGAERAGTALQSGLAKYTQEFKERSGVLFREVERKIPPETVVQSPETVALIRDMMETYADRPAIIRELGLDRWAAIADDLEAGLSWKAASDLRSSIGQSIGKLSGPMADMDGGRLKQVYGTLTRDLETAARDAGPEAERAWRRANNYYRRGAERLNEYLDKTVTADSPERAFEAFAAMMKDGRSTADARRIYTIKASMPREEWGTVAASIVDRLGRAAPGGQNAGGDVFSPSKFLTEWNRLSPAAKSVLLPEGQRKQMEQLAQVAEGVRRANAERNFSNTGTATGWLAVVFGSAADLGTTAAAVGGATVGARAMTSERFLRALNNAARGDMKQMRDLAGSSSPYAEDARTILLLSSAQASQGGAAANSTAAPALRQMAQ